MTIEARITGRLESTPLHRIGGDGRPCVAVDSLLSLHHLPASGLSPGNGLDRSAHLPSVAPVMAPKTSAPDRQVRRRSIRRTQQ